jgi:hypothetical protein
MDILNFISWIRGKRVVNTVDPAKTLIPVGLRDDRRDDDYLAGAISVEDLAAQIGGSSTYKVYTALLTQTGTNPPVATVLENTLGGTLVWTRDSDGYYTATLAGAFPDENKFFTLNSIIFLSIENIVSVGWVNSNSFIVYSSFWNGVIPTAYTPQDDILYNYPIEIRVYN